MKYRTGAEIRALFLKYFEENGHKIETSSPLVPNNDPTLLWINSGVAALKQYFDGSSFPENPRIVNAQKSIRTNDIENVGITARHHTFFEMLGNFSIGDYFREEAIRFGWEFLTSPKWIGFDKDKLYVTVYPSDIETKRVWSEVIGLNTNQIIETAENYWEIGKGPCGPCTEIFYDRGVEFEFDTPKEDLFPSGENERWLEIYNIVLSQFDADPELPRSEYKELPSKNIDTGMGLERMASIIQNKKTNFETDLIYPLITAIEQLSTKRYGDSLEIDTAFKVISDHIRTLTFAIADGALPSNEGRGYVLRRLLRRATRFAMKLDLHEAFMYKLIPIIPEMMGDYYSYLNDKVEFIQKIVKKEENKFIETLSGGLKILESILIDQTSQEIEAKIAFKLYDTYGFPFELTEEFAKENNLTVSRSDFETYLDGQRTRARSARKTADSMSGQNETLMNFKDESIYTGYSNSHEQAKVIYFDNNSSQVIFDRTPFYAESGGQISDSGTIKLNDDVIGEIIEVVKAPFGQHLHKIKLTNDRLNVGDTVSLEVDVNKQRFTRKNHSATHILHKVLRDYLGTHVEQAGSLVTPSKLRFDFNHFNALNEGDIKLIERRVNEVIFNSLNVTTEIMSIDLAKEKGAMALFGEKYGTTVRVVEMGDFSIELCGGLHVFNTSEIGLFKIVSESGIGSGIRRIEAMTSKDAFHYFEHFEENINKIKTMLNVKNSSDIIQKVSTTLTKIQNTEKELDEIKNEYALSQVDSVIAAKHMLKSVNIYIHEFNELDTNQVKTLADAIKNNDEKAVVILLSKLNTTTVCVSVHKSLTPRINANDIIKFINVKLEGKGGGKPDFATARIQRAENFSSYTNDLIEFIRESEKE